MLIIPAIDSIDGEVVRLTEGDYNRKTTYDVSGKSESPIASMISKYEENNISHIHLIDLNGAKNDQSNESHIFAALRVSKAKVQIGGGIRTIEKAKRLLDNGAFRLIVGTVAVTDPQFLVRLKEIANPDQIIIGIDVWDEVIRINGWQESSPLNLFSFIRNCIDMGYQRFLCTDISKDGKLQGPSVELYKKLKLEFSGINLIASGGVSSMKDIEVLETTGAESVIVGKAIYENRISLEEVRNWNSRILNKISN